MPSRKARSTIDEGDQIWVLAEVTRLEHDAAGDITRVTVLMSNGHKETLTYDPDDFEPVGGVQG